MKLTKQHFTAKQLEKYADSLLWGLDSARTGKYRKGDCIAIRFDLTAHELANVLQMKILDRGMNPIMMPLPLPEHQMSFYAHAEGKQLEFLRPGTKELYKRMNGSVYIPAPEKMTHLKNFSHKISRASKSTRSIFNIREQREAAGLFAWTVGVVPTGAMARQAGMSVKDYTREIVRACFLDESDPVARWADLKKRGSQVIAYLNDLTARTEYFHVKSENTDMAVTPGERRQWLGLSGHNIPSFEIFMSPDWRGCHGTYFANEPSFRSGNYVRGVRLTIEKGRVVGVEAEEGEDFVREQIAIDEGACSLGEFSLTDKRFSPIRRFMANTLYDENVGGRFGNCHMAIGYAFPESFAGDLKKVSQARLKRLGFNKSAQHWDLITTENRTVTARLKDGSREVIYKNGMFTCLKN